MPIDPSINLQYQQPDIANILAKVNALKAAQQDNALRALQMKQAQMQIGEQQRQITQQNALREAARGAFQNGQFNRNAFLGAVAPIDPLAAAEYGSKFATQDADVANKQAMTRKQELENASQQIGIIAQLLGSVNDEQSWEMAKQQGKAMGLDISQYEAMPYNPQVVSRLGQMTLTAQQRIQNELEKEKLAEQSKHNAAQLAQDQTQFAETQRHNRATEGISLAGQIRTDARMREQNQIARDTKVEMAKTARDAKTEAAKNGELNRLDGLNADLDRLATSANEVLQSGGLAGITGLRGALPNIPGGQAADAQAKLNTLKSQVAFGVLQNMRNNSKTGGALGQVSDRENRMLEENLASLDKAQSYGEMQKALRKIIQYSNDAKARARAAVERQYGAQPGGESAGANDPLGLFR